MATYAPSIFFVKRFHGNNRHYLSALSSHDLSPQPWNNDHENLTLFFYNELIPDIQITPCNGLLYFDNFNGEPAICHPTTQKLKFLPPSNFRPPHRALSTQFEASGFGYDPRSDDYKVVRFVSHSFDYYEQTSPTRYQIELYSLRNDSWRRMACTVHLGNICPESALLLDDSCYWISHLGTTDQSHGVISFDLSTEVFDTQPLPPTLAESDDIIRLVQHDGCLGVIAYQKSGNSKRFQLWVWNQGRWSKVFKFILSGVRSIVGLIDETSLFLEGRANTDGLCQLMAYDWVDEKMKFLDVYDYRGEMKVVPFVEGGPRFPRLRNAIPLNGDHNQAVDVECYRSMDCSSRTMHVNNGMKTDTESDDEGDESDDDHPSVSAWW